MDTRIMKEIAQKKRLACKIANLEAQKDIEVDRKRKRELETQWILHGGKYPE